MGLRDQKKAKTRKMISDLATKLFVKKGYDAVTTAEIARLAEVSVPTLFNYFPTKEALVFDEDLEREEQLVRCVVERKKGTNAFDALWLEFANHFDPELVKHYPAFRKMIDETPALAAYERSMWMRHQEALGKAIRKTAKIKLSEIEANTIAGFALDAFHSSLKTADPKSTLKKLFHLLENGCKEI